MCQGGLFFHAAVLYCIFEEYPYEFVAAMSCASCDGVKFSHDIPLYAHGKRLMPVLALHALWSEHQFVLCQSITQFKRRQQSAAGSRIYCPKSQ